MTHSSNIPKVDATGCCLRFSETSFFSDGSGVCVSSSIFTEWSRAWKQEKEDLYEKGQLTWWTLSKRIGCIPSNILQRVKQWKSIQKGWGCFLYSLKTSKRLTNAEPYFCAVYNDIIFKKCINNNKDKTKEILIVSWVSLYLIKTRLNFMSNFLDQITPNLNVSARMSRSISEDLKLFKKLAVVY